MTSAEFFPALETYLFAVNEALFRYATGDTAFPKLSTLRAPYAPLFSEESLALTRRALVEARGGEARESAERVLFVLLEGAMDAHRFPLQEDVEKARKQHGGEYLERQRLSATSLDGAKKVHEQHVEMARRLQSKLLEAHRVFKKRLAVYGFMSEREYAEARKRISYDALLQKIIPMLEETTGLYRRVVSEMSRARFGSDLGHAHLWQAEHVFARVAAPANFARDRFPHLLTMAFERMGLDPHHFAGVTIRTESAGHESAHAAFAPLHVPRHIHAFVNPVGAFPDDLAFMRVTGRAIHAAATDPTLPFPFRELPRSSALSETFGTFFANLFTRSAWLEHVLRFPKNDALMFSAEALLGNLFRLRRDIAAFSYSLAFDAALPSLQMEKLHERTFQDLTGFVHDKALYVEDADLDFAAADRIRAAISAMQLEEHVERAFGDRWFLRRETGQFLRQLFAKGAAWEAEDMVASMGMAAWDTLPLVRSFDGLKRLLGS